MKGKLYGVGVGPGDPDLLTLKAVKVLQACDTVIIPRTKDRTTSRAFEISREHIPETAEVLPQIFPMNFNTDEVQEAWRQNAAEITHRLDQGRTVVFITIGDPMIYSTFIYLYELIQPQCYSVEIVPGIPSFCEAAARTGMPLCKANEVLRVYPISNNPDDLADALDSDDTLVLMKVYRQYGALVQKMRAANRLHSSVLVSEAGLENEQIIHDLEDGGNDVTYLSTIISRKQR